MSKQEMKEAQTKTKKRPAQTETPEEKLGSSGVTFHAAGIKRISEMTGLPYTALRYYYDWDYNVIR